jgi:hypothetical protein
MARIVRCRRCPAQLPVGGVSICCHVRCVPAPPASVGCLYLCPSGPTYSPVAGSYSAAAIGGGGAAGAAPGEAGGPPGEPRGYRLPRVELWDTPPGQCRVRVALPVEAVVERDVGLVAFALFDCRRPLARPRPTRIVACATHRVEGRILRYPAINQARRPRRGVLKDRRALLLSRKKPGGTRRRPVQIQIETQAKASASSCARPTNGQSVNMGSHYDELSCTKRKMHIC